MDSPTSQPTSQSAQSPTETGADVLVRDGAVKVELQAGDDATTHCGYSLLICGEVQPSSILSNGTGNETVTLLENDTKLVSGNLDGGTAGFVVEGTIVAAEFDDDDAATVTLDGAYVDMDRWPSVSEYLGHGPGQEPVADPFPGSGELGAVADDPLNPEEYVIELDANELDSPEAYCFDVDGDVLETTGGPTVTKQSDRVFGCLRPGKTATITIRGHVTWIETADRLEFTIGARDPA